MYSFTDRHFLSVVFVFACIFMTNIPSVHSQPYMKFSIMRGTATYNVLGGTYNLPFQVDPTYDIDRHAVNGSYGGGTYFAGDPLPPEGQTTVFTAKKWIVPYYAQEESSKYPSGISESDLQVAISLAAGQWSYDGPTSPPPACYLELARGHVLTTGISATDNKNNVVFQNAQDNGIVGITLLTVEFESGGGQRAIIQDADIVLNNTKNWEIDEMDIENDVYDVISVLTHEMGHSIGFWHSFYGYSYPPFPQYTIGQLQAVSLEQAGKCPSVDFQFAGATG